MSHGGNCTEQVSTMSSESNTMCMRVHILERHHSEGTRASTKGMLCVPETESFVCGFII